MAARPKTERHYPRPQRVGFTTKPERQPFSWHRSHQGAGASGKELADGKPLVSGQAVVGLLPLPAAVSPPGTPRGSGAGAAEDRNKATSRHPISAMPELEKEGRVDSNATGTKMGFSGTKENE